MYRYRNVGIMASIVDEDSPNATGNTKPVHLINPTMKIAIKTLRFMPYIESPQYLPQTSFYRIL